MPAPNLHSSAAQFAAVRDYVRLSWQKLTRSCKSPSAALHDPKLPKHKHPPLYLSHREDFSAITTRLRAAAHRNRSPAPDIRVLPPDPGTIEDHGLLYLPHPYIVPGGRFNEMYGWDSFFIILGLLRDGRLRLARQMVDNLAYEVDHYGWVLNANRTYYLTRSHPPLLPAAVLAVFAHTGDRNWLHATQSAIAKYYSLWIEEPRLTPQTGLSRYFDIGHGPAPEVVAAERDEAGRTHYDRVRHYFRTNPVSEYDKAIYYDLREDCLTDAFYRADRSMRESGFDPSDRFGRFSADIVSYNPVCLNSLLFKYERDAQHISEILGKRMLAERWRRRSVRRRLRIDRYLWDAQTGLYLDYRYRDDTRRHYPFATTFYPLWVGLASRTQAARVAANLHILERAGGIMTSNKPSGSQWDAPFGWAPLHLITVRGLQRYGFTAAAERVSIKFLSIVVQGFQRHNTTFEKYDVLRRTADVDDEIAFGYAENVPGCAWTNAVFNELTARSPTPRQ